MSDERVRELERAYRATGALDDERRWLLERLRTGALPQARLELAAYVGHEAARLVLGDAALPVPADLTGWVAGLAAWELEVVVRAGLGVSRFVLTFAEPDVASAAPLVALADAVTAWVETPTDELLRAIGVAARTLTLPVLMRAGTARLPLQAAFAVQSCFRDLTRHASRRRGRGQGAPGAAVGVTSGAVQAARVLGEGGVRAALRDALVPWALR